MLETSFEALENSLGNFVQMDLQIFIFVPFVLLEELELILYFVLYQIQFLQEEVVVVQLVFGIPKEYILFKELEEFERILEPFVLLLVVWEVEGFE